MWPTQPPVQWLMAFFLEINRPTREVDQSVPSSAEVKNKWRCTSTPPISFLGLEKDKFTVNWYDLLSLSSDKWQAKAEVIFSLQEMFFYLRSLLYQPVTNGRSATNLEHLIFCNQFRNFTGLTIVS